MTFQESIRVCFSKYADFTGTASRSEYSALFNLVTLLPLLAAGARRLHDTGRSGWWQLLGLVPVAGTAVVAFLLALKGRGRT